jgi:hypothetical protein
MSGLVLGRPGEEELDGDHVSPARNVLAVIDSGSIATKEDRVWQRGFGWF